MGRLAFTIQCVGFINVSSVSVRIIKLNFLVLLSPTKGQNESVSCFRTTSKGQIESILCFHSLTESKRLVDSTVLTRFAGKKIVFVMGRRAVN
jgi:hypothetical protein